MKMFGVPTEGLLESLFELPDYRGVNPAHAY